MSTIHIDNCRQGSGYGGGGSGGQHCNIDEHKEQMLMIDRNHEIMMNLFKKTIGIYWIR
jgi:hypothetical protein